MENLESDYEEFQRVSNTLKIAADINFPEIIREDVLEHLREISNQDMTISITNVAEDILVKDLIKEIKMNSDIGTMYMLDWYENLKFIDKIKNKK